MNHGTEIHNILCAISKIVLSKIIFRNQTNCLFLSFRLPILLKMLGMQDTFTFNTTAKTDNFGLATLAVKWLDHMWKLLYKCDKPKCLYTVHNELNLSCLSEMISFYPYLNKTKNGSFEENVSPNTNHALE